MKKQSPGDAEKQTHNLNDTQRRPRIRQAHSPIEDDDAADEKKETRRLVHWVIKVLILTFAFVSGSVVLAFCYALLFHENGLEHELVQLFGTFMSTIVEIIKFLFSNGNA